MGNIYVNNPVKINFNIGIDTDETSAILLKYRNPLGVETINDEVEIAVSATGDCYVEIPNDVLDTAGTYTFWSYVTTEDGDFAGDQFPFEILGVAFNITNLDTIKSYLGYDDTTYDAKISLLIPGIEDAYLDIRNAPFDTDPDGNIIYPAGAATTVAEMIEYRINVGLSELRPMGFDTIRLGSYSVSYGSGGGAAGLMGGYPKSITSQIKSYVRGA